MWRLTGSGATQRDLEKCKFVVELMRDFDRAMGLPMSGETMGENSLSCVRMMTATLLIVIFTLLFGAPGSAIARPLPTMSTLAVTGEIVHLAQDGLQTDALTGSKVWLPGEHRKTDAPSYTGGRGQNYVVKGLIVSMLRFNADERSLNDLYQTYQKNRTNSRSINWQQSWKQPERFALIGKDGDGAEFTIDVAQQADQLRGLSIYLPNINSSNAEELRRIARRIRESWQAFPGTSPGSGTANVTPSQPMGPGPEPVRPIAHAPPSVTDRQPDLPVPAPVPAWSVPRRTSDGAFERYVGADLTGDVLLESRSGAVYSDEKCADACAKTSTCRAYTRYGDGRCVMRSNKGDVRQAPSNGATSGVRSSSGS